LNTLHRAHPIIGLRLQHQPVSSLEGQDLLHKINQLIVQAEAKPVLLVAGSTKEHIIPRQLGAHYNPKLIASHSLVTGRQGSILHRLVDQDAALLGRRNVSLSFDTIDRSIALAYFNNLNQQISRQPVDAHFDYQKGQVVIVNEQNGQELNIAQAEAIIQKLGQQTNQPARLDLPLSSSQAAITAQDLKPLLPDVQKIISQPIVLQAAGKQVDVSPAELSQIVIPVKQADPKQPTQTKVSIGFNDSRLSAAIDKLAAQVSVNPQPKIVSGNTVISQGVSGTHVDGTHAKVEVVSELLKRVQPNPGSTTPSKSPTPALTPTPAPAAISTKPPPSTVTPTATTPTAPAPVPTLTAPAPTPTPTATPPSANAPVSATAPAPASTPTATPTEVSIEVGEINPPVVNLYAETNPGGRYPASNQDKKMIYLTFDDGPGGYTAQILDTLKKYNVHGIFFLVGRNMTVYPNTVKRIKAEGHTIGNHSYTHVDLSKLSDAGISDELARTQNTIKDLAGVQADLFRPPYGSINSKVYTLMTKLQLNLMMWSIDPRDWSKPGIAEITKRVLDGLKPGGNVLLHTLHQQTVEALPAIIEGIRAHGYTLN